MTEVPINCLLSQLMRLIRWPGFCFLPYAAIVSRCSRGAILRARHIQHLRRATARRLQNIRDEEQHRTEQHTLIAPRPLVPRMIRAGQGD
jgi:hypothetical protein